MNDHSLWQMIAALVLTLSTNLTAADVTDADGPRWQNPWSRATPAGAANGAVFITLINGSTVARSVVSASTAVATRVELHTHAHVGDVVRMVQVQAFPVAAAATASLRPGGDHIMLFGLTAPLRGGQVLPVELIWDDGKHEVVAVPVIERGVAPPR